MGVCCFRRGSLPCWNHYRSSGHGRHCCHHLSLSECCFGGGLPLGWRQRVLGDLCISRVTWFCRGGGAHLCPLWIQNNSSHLQLELELSHLCSSFSPHDLCRKRRAVTTPNATTPNNNATMMQGGMRPGIILLREGTDTSQVSGASGITRVTLGRKSFLKGTCSAMLFICKSYWNRIHHNSSLSLHSR